MRRRAQLIIGKGWYGLWALMMVLLVVGAVHTSPAAHADATGSMHVVVPVPSSDGKTVQGPVGANVSVSMSQATAGATYNLGWANVTTGCASVFNPFTNGTITVMADSSGAYVVGVSQWGSFGETQTPTKLLQPWRIIKLKIRD